MRKPSQALTKAYALQMFSAQQGAPLKAQSRYKAAFQRAITPEQQTDQEFQRLLESQAKAWWSTRISKGTGVDW